MSANTSKKSPGKRKTPAKSDEDGTGGAEESPTKQKKQRTPAKEAKAKEDKDERYVFTGTDLYVLIGMLLTVHG